MTNKIKIIIRKNKKKKNINKFLLKQLTSFYYFLLFISIKLLSNSLI